MKTFPPKATRSAAGFTLVELMVAMLIGLALVIVISQLFIGSRRTIATTDDISRMQENMRFATHLMARTVHYAGYRSGPNTQLDTIFGAPNLALEGVAGAGTAPDELTVRFQGNGAGAGPGTGDGTVVNCHGERIPAGTMSTNTFRIQTIAGVPTLTCETTNAAGTNSVRALVADVDNMKILYGEDTDDDGSANRFVTRASVTQINNVVALRIAMLFRSPNIATTTALNTTVYTLNAQNLTAFDDTRARRDAVFTANVRNRGL